MCRTFRHWTCLYLIAKRSLPIGAVGKTSVGCRSHHSAWNDYIRHHIVSANAARTISNFLAAAECSPDDVEEARVEAGTKPDREVDTSWVDMTTVQRLTTGEGFQYSKRSAQTVQSLVHDWTTPQTSTSNPRAAAVLDRHARPPALHQQPGQLAQIPSPNKRNRHARWPRITEPSGWTRPERGCKL